MIHFHYSIFWVTCILLYHLWILHFWLGLYLFFLVLFKCSLFISALFPNWINIFITKALNSLSCKLFIFYFFPRVFSCSFKWEYFLCLLILLNFLYLEEFRSNILSEVVLLCGSVSIQTVCAECLWWESWIWHGFRSRLSSGCADSYLLGRRWAWWWRG